MLGRTCSLEIKPHSFKGSRCHSRVQLALALLLERGRRAGGGRGRGSADSSHLSPDSGSPKLPTPFIQVGSVTKTLVCGGGLVLVHIHFGFSLLLFLGWNLFLSGGMMAAWGVLAKWFCLPPIFVLRNILALKH